MAERNRASFTGFAIVLRRESLLPWKEPAQSNDWHFTEPASDLLTSDVTRSELQAASPQTTEPATTDTKTCLIMTKPRAITRNAVQHTWLSSA
jgi:hypothetical protein